MNAYVLMMVAVLAFALCARGNQKGNTLFILFALAAMFVIMGLRDVTALGNDSRTSFYWQFQRIVDSAWSELPKFLPGERNPGIVYLLKLVAAAGGDYYTFNMVFSAIVLISFGFMVKQYSDSPVQSCCYYWGLLTYLLMFDAMKQALAMSVLIFAFDAIIKKKPIRFLLLVLFASCFHYPALVFLPAYLIARVKIERGFLLLMAALLVVVFIFRNQIINFMLAAYKGEDEQISLEGVAFLGTKVIIMLVILVVSIVLRPLGKDDTVYNTLIKFVGVATVFQTFCYYNNIFERLADYYFQFATILLPMVFDSRKQRCRILEPQTERVAKTLASYAFCAFGVWRFANVISNDWHYASFHFFFR